LTDQRDFDLIIAGAGPAGAALAYRMAAGGASVLLLEKQEAPARDRNWVVDVEEGCFSRANIPFPTKDSLWKKPREHFLATSDMQTMIEIERVPLVSVKNDLYIREVLNRAVNAGITLMCGREACSPILNRDCVVGLESRDSSGAKEKIYARIVADCTGINAALRTRTPDHWRMNESIEPEDVVFARREVRSVRKDLLSEEMICKPYRDGVRIDRSGARGPYSIESVFLDLKDLFVDILVGAKPDAGGKRTCAEMIDTIIDKMPFTGEVLYGGEGPIPIRSPHNCPVGNGIISIGDSAFQTVPIHGSGFASAVIAAEIAARNIIHALEIKRYDRKALWTYVSEFARGRGALIAYYDVIRRSVDKMRLSDIDRMIRAGIIGQRETVTGLSVRPFPVSPVYLAGKIIRGYRHFPLLVRFGIAGVRAKMEYEKYRKYPKYYE